MSVLSFVRQRFGLIMVAIVLVVCIGLLVHQHFFPSTASTFAPVTNGTPTATVPSEPPPQPMEPAELRAQWQAAVATVLSDYDRTSDARAAKEHILAIRVPAVDRDVHLALFLAFNALSESRPEGKDQLKAARSQFERAP